MITREHRTVRHKQLAPGQSSLPSSRWRLGITAVIAMVVPFFSAPVISVNAATEPTGSVSGVVQAADSGATLGGIRIDVRSTDALGGAWDIRTDSEDDGSFAVDLSGCFEAAFSDPTGNYARETIYGCISDGDDDVLDVQMQPAGTISGAITDVVSGLPISGACVDVYSSSDRLLDTVGSACSGSDGRYTVGGLAQGEYVLWFRDPGGGHHTEVYDDGTFETVEVDSGSNRAGIDAALTPRRPAGAVLHIDVIDADTGVPLTGCLVTIIWRGADEGPDDIETGACDESGRASFDDPLPGPYDIYVEPGDPSLHDAYDGSVEVEGDLQPVIVELQRTLSIVGSVLTPTGQPVPSVTVTACPHGRDPANEEPCTEAAVDASGNYRLSPLVPGPYIVTFVSAGLAAGWSPDIIEYGGGAPVDVGDGVSLSGIDAVFTPIGGSIAGTVTAGGAASPLGRVVVRAYRFDEPSPFASTVSNTLGRYTLQNLPIGSYHVEFDAVGFVTEWFDNTTTTPTEVVVTGGAVTEGIDAQLDREGAITGIVTSEPGAQGTNSREYCVTVSRVGDPSVSGTDCAQFGARYRVGELPAGEYVVQFSSAHYNTEWWDDASSFQDAAPVVVVAGASTTANSVLTRRGALSGTITDHTTGEPIPNVLVYAIPMECDESCWWTEVLTDSAGRFLIVTNGDPGSYAIYAEAARAGTHRPGYFAGLGELVDPEAATPLVVSQTGVTTGVDFTLDPYPTISGRVTDKSSGLPLKGAVIFLQNAESQMFEGSARTDANGEYRVPAPEGEYWVVFTRSGYRAEAHPDVPGSDCIAGDPTPCTSVDTTDGSSYVEVDAALARANHALTASTTGSGTGAVVSKRAGIDCGAICSVAIEDDRWIALSTVPSVGSTFTGWSGACTGTGYCVVPMTQARSVVAEFTLKSYQLSVTKTGTGSGTVSSNPPGIACGATCLATYDHGTSVTLTAAAPFGSLFSSWSGACTGTGSCVVSMTEARSVTASFRAVRVVPSAPSSVRWTPGDGVVAMSWTVPSRPGDAPITGYEYSVNSGAWVSFSAQQLGVQSLSGTIGGLTNGRSYRVRVRAVSAAGPGAPSSTVSVTPSTVPSVPSGLTVTPANRSVSVRFTAPFNGGSSITRYDYSIDGGTTWVRRTSTATSFTVSGLTNGASYRVAVRAVNARGVGNASGVAESVPRTTPGLPTGVAVAPADRQLTVGWVAPVSDGGSPITRFDVSIDGGRRWTTVDADVRSQVFTGLVNGRSYQVRVRAVNAAGAGSSTSSVRAVPAVVPTAPSRLTVTAGNRSASVRFTAPFNGGSSIVAYEYSLDGGAAWVRRSSTSTSFTIAGLSNGTEYLIAVRAVNAVGPGAASALVPVSPRTVPGPPTGVVVTTSNRSLTVTWIRPADDGGSTINSFQVSLDGGSRWTTTAAEATSYTATGLTNGRTYRIRVRAINAAGAGSSTSSINAVPRA